MSEPTDDEQRMGWPRWVLLVSVAFIAVVVVFGVLLAPMVYAYLFR